MFGFTRKTDYALVALAGLADVARAESGGDTPARRSARQLAERFGVPVPVLMNVLKDLVNGGLVSSTRGARGGYALARDPGGISVHDVIAAIEGPVQVTNCCEPELETAGAPANGGATAARAIGGGSGATNGCATDCRIEVHCPITGTVRRLNQRIHEYLSEVTLADLLNDADAHAGPLGRRVHDLKFRPIAEGDR